MYPDTCVMCENPPAIGEWGVFCSEECFDRYDVEFEAYCDAIKAGETEWPT